MKCIWNYNNEIILHFGDFVISRLFNLTTSYLETISFFDIYIWALTRFNSQITWVESEWISGQITLCLIASLSGKPKTERDCRVDGIP